MSDIYTAITKMSKALVKGQHQFDFRDIAQDAMLYTLEKKLKDVALTTLKTKHSFVDTVRREQTKAKNEEGLAFYLYKNTDRNYQGLFYQELYVYNKEMHRHIENKTELNFYQRREALKRLKNV